MAYNPLTPEEEYIILRKGTECPFTGKYLNNKAEGTYTCRQCDAPLYYSETKFNSHCGWPSFDDEIPGAVTRVPDIDGSRVEIVCSNCGGHLGHVFTGEGFTAKNTRHCVNSISMNFVPKRLEALAERVVLACGDHWNAQLFFSKLDGVLAVKSGFTGGTEHPRSFIFVRGQKTGHAEAIQVDYDPKVITFEKLLQEFFEFHDFSNAEKQGEHNDGVFRSAVFYFNKQQKETVEQVINQLKEKEFEVQTQVEQATVFFPSDDRKQVFFNGMEDVPEPEKFQKIF